MSEIMGTAFLVDGTWYLRFVGGGGGMVPIDADAAVKDELRNGEMFRLTGYMSTDGRGCPRSVQASAVKRLGGNKDT